MDRCIRCELDTAHHTLLTDDGPRPFCAVCLFLVIYEAQPRGETAIVSVAPAVTAVA